MIPPGQSAAFVADMERVLALYAESYDAACPVVCFDERPCVLHDDVRALLPMRSGSQRKQDHEYVRGGTCCPTHRRWVGWPPSSHCGRGGGCGRSRSGGGSSSQPSCGRSATRCTRTPSASALSATSSGGPTPGPTHGPASFYEAFAPAEARRLAAKVEFVHTPVHGSWLNAVEVELSVFVRPCLGRRRIGTVEVLRTEAEAWAERRKAEGGTVAWQVTTEDARTKLRRLYPSTTT